MTKNKYSYKNIKSISFPDLVRVTIQSKVGRSNSKVNTLGKTLDLDQFNGPNEGNFKAVKHDYLSLKEPGSIRRCRLFPSDPKRGSVIRHENFDIVTVRLTFNGQEVLRKIVLDLLNMEKVSNVIWGQSKNYIPARLYRMLEESGVELSELQGQVIRNLNILIQSTYDKMKKDYYNLFGVNVKDSKTMIYLKQVEICTDFVGPINYEMARDFTFKKQFDEVIHNHIVSYFKDNRKHIIADPGCEVVDGFQTVKQVVGYYHGGIQLKAYLKSRDRVGSTNRVESKYNSSALDKLFYWGRWVPYDGDMPLFGVIDRIQKLIRIHSQLVSRVLRYKPLSRKPKLKKRIRLAIRYNCGVHASDITKTYLGFRKLLTGKGTPLTRGASAVIRKLCREGKVFKKSKKHKASYYVSPRYLNQFYGQF